MRPVDFINAFPPGITGGGDWYDEMLISGDRVIVIGYSYARGGTEVNRFRLSTDGHLRFEDAYHFRSNDYYSSRNYASRLIGNRLVYYTPLYLNWGGGDPWDSFPAGQPLATGQQAGVPPHRPRTRRLHRSVAAQRRGGRARHAAQRDGLRPHRAGDGLQGDRRAGARPAALSTSARPPSICGSAMPATGAPENAAGRRAGSIACRSTGSKSPQAIGAAGQPTDQFSFREDRRWAWSMC
jgi:hypothetical protein